MLLKLCCCIFNHFNVFVCSQFVDLCICPLQCGTKVILPTAQFRCQTPNPLPPPFFPLTQVQPCTFTHNHMVRRQNPQ